jgi:hypothetical protein
MPIAENSEQKTINLGIISYRLNEIEKSLDKNMESILLKIDKLIQKHNDNEVMHTELKIKVAKMEDEVKELRAVDTKVQEEISNVKVSLAEKMGYGVLGGSLMTVLVKTFEAFGGN